MKSTIKKLVLSLISISLLGSITAPTVPPTNIYAAKTSKNKTITINGKKISRAAFTRKLKHAKVVYHVSKKQVNQILKKKPADASAISTRFAPAIAATAFIPGIGEAALTVGGAIIIGGATIAAGSWLYNKCIQKFSPHRSNARHSTRDKHTKPRPGRSSEKKKGSKKWHSRK